MAWEPHRARALLVALAMVGWSFAWGNARMLQTLADYDLTSFVPLPRSAKFLEVGALFALCVLILAARRPPERRWTIVSTTFLCLVAAATISALVSVIFGFVEGVPAAQTTYDYLAPLAVGVVLQGMDSHERDPSIVAWSFIGVVVLHAAVAYYQVLVAGRIGDDVHGLMHDAHMFANVVWLAVLWLATRITIVPSHRWKSLILLLLLVPVGYASANEKGNIALTVSLGSFLAWRMWRKGGYQRWALAGGVSLVVLAFGAMVSERVALPRSLWRWQFVARNLSSLGVIQGYRDVGKVFVEVPHGVVFGTGPGSYGSAQAVEFAINGGSAPPLLAERYTAESYRFNVLSKGAAGSFVERSTDLTSFAVEFGLMGVALFIIGLFAAAVLPAAEASRLDGPGAVLGIWVLLSLLYIGLVSAGTAFYGWSLAHTSSMPVMAVAGLLGARRNKGR